MEFSGQLDSARADGHRAQFHVTLSTENWLIGIILAVLGLAIGSFLNVVIHRVPRNLSVIRPRSSCPQCRRTLSLVENIPVLSWVLLRGRCLGCKASISFRYPLVELGTAICFVATYARFGRDWILIPFEIGMAGMITLAVIDAEQLVLPKRIVWMHLGLVAATMAPIALLTHRLGALGTAIGVALVWCGAFYAINAATPRLLGFGDVRYSLVLGLLLGWISVPTALVGYFLANLVGVVATVALLALKKTTRDTPLPYGTYLSAGAMLGIWFGGGLLHAIGH
jgi:leader peptidase (prepilin peptidase)/N-methyltransferase